MRLLTPARVVLGVCLSLLWLGLPAARAEPEKVKFESVDGVELHGIFYSSDRAKKMPTILMLHRIGGSSQEEGWDSLATALSKKGFSVLTFDFRGHGNSANLRDARRFWSVPTNQAMAKNPSRTKETISIKDFRPAYEPYLANDIAAAKLFLDKKNDGGDCNTANLILIGAEGGANLGLLWMSTEWSRYRLIPQQPGIALAGFSKEPEARDFVYCLWLSPSSYLGGQAAPVHEWIRFNGREHRIPMTFVHGEQDTNGSSFAKQAFNELKPAKGDKFTKNLPVKGTKLVGSKLLNKTLDTEKDLLSLCQDFVEDKSVNDWGTRDTRKCAFYWVAGASRVLAKNPDEDTINWIPFAQLGIRLGP